MSRISKNLFKQVKVHPESNSNSNSNFDLELGRNPDYISSESESESESESRIFGIAFGNVGNVNIGKKDDLSKLKSIFEKDIEMGFEDCFENEAEDFGDYCDYGEKDDEFRGSEICFRSYSIASEKDDWNIRFGRCPDYALSWGHNFNQKHWPPGHDYINGYNGAPGRNEFVKHVV